MATGHHVDDGIHLVGVERLLDAVIGKARAQPEVVVAVRLGQEHGGRLGLGPAEHQPRLVKTDRLRPAAGSAPCILGANRARRNLSDGNGAGAAGGEPGHRVVVLGRPARERHPVGRAARKGARHLAAAYHIQVGQRLLNTVGGRGSGRGVVGDGLGQDVLEVQLERVAGRERGEGDVLHLGDWRRAAGVVVVDLRLGIEGDGRQRPCSVRRATHQLVGRVVLVDDNHGVSGLRPLQVSGNRHRPRRYQVIQPGAVDVIDDLRIPEKVNSLFRKAQKILLVSRVVRKPRQHGIAASVDGQVVN